MSSEQWILCQQNTVKNPGRYRTKKAEYRLLCLLMQSPNIILSKEKILDKLWDGEGNCVDDNTLAVYIRRLRMKIENNPGDPHELKEFLGSAYNDYDLVIAFATGFKRFVSKITLK